MIRRGEADDGGEELRGAFRGILAAHPEPPMDDLTAAAVTGGRRLRRRRRVGAATALTTAVVVGVGVVTGLAQPAVQQPPPPAVPADRPTTGPEPGEREPEVVPWPEELAEDPQVGPAVPEDDPGPNGWEAPGAGTEPDSGTEPDGVREHPTDTPGVPQAPAPE